MKNLKFDDYTIYARFFPCAISALPFFVLWFFISEFKGLKDLISFILRLKFLGVFSISIVFLYFYSQLIRVTSKFLEKKYFINNKGFPTTYLMTFQDKTFSEDYKKKYRERIKSFFSLELLDRDEEANKKEEAQKRLNEATKQVILKVGDGHLVKKHNIWYGFFRNLIGGLIYSTFFSLLNIGIGIFILSDNTLIFISLILFLFFAVILIFHKSILIQNAEAYAGQLIAEFMSLKK